MDINIFHKTKKLAAIQSPLVRKTSWHRVARDPAVDWVFLFLLFVACTAVLIVIGVTTYIDEDDVLSRQPTVMAIHPKAILNVQDLTAVGLYFDDRASTTVSLLKGTSVPADPSF